MTKARGAGSDLRCEDKSEEINATIPLFPNWFPYNDLLLDGKLIAKSRSWTWKHRGLTLLYTSSRVARSVAAAHGMDPKKYPRKAIVGVGDLIEVRPLNAREWRTLSRQFNNSWAPDRQFVEPLPIGYFFENLRRFETPVPYSWPQGPVLPITIPAALVAGELHRLGIRIS